MTESTQHKLSRVRPPRVQITYDVEIGDAIEMKELPLVVGVMADLAGKPEEPLPYLKNRKFVEIDRDNFDDVLASLKPRIAVRVDNKLAAEGEEESKMNVELNFRKMDDFKPAAIVQQVEPLRKLYEARQRLNDLLSKLDGNDDLDGLLQEVAANTDEQKKIKDEVAKADSGEEGKDNG